MGLFRGRCGIVGTLLRIAAICFTFDVVIGFDLPMLACRCIVEAFGRDDSA